MQSCPINPSSKRSRRPLLTLLSTVKDVLNVHYISLHGNYTSCATNTKGHAILETCVVCVSTGGRLSGVDRSRIYDKIRTTPKKGAPKGTPTPQSQKVPTIR